MKRIFSVLFLAAALFGCPDVEPPPPTTPPPSQDGGSCAADADCGGQKACCGGVCVDTSKEVNHCGACGTVCSAEKGETVCSAGQCAIAACTLGFGDCNQTFADGCEVSLQTDPANCGVCGNACELEHATARCGVGMCGIATCDEGFADCNDSPQDGCEIDLQHDTANCGTCGNACGAGEQCTNGACRINALIGFGGEADELSTYSAQVWKFDLGTKKFSTVATTGEEQPGARAGMVGAWDGEGHRLIIWGGSRRDGVDDPDVWALDFTTDPATWIRSGATSTSPGDRLMPCAAVDVAGHALYAFGGMTRDGSQPSDLWKLDLASLVWTRVNDGTGTAPPSGAGAACAWDAEQNRFVMFGGSAGAEGMSNRVWAWNADGFTGWEELTTTATPAGRYAAKFFDGAAPLTLFGGLTFDPESYQISLPTDVRALRPNLAWSEELPDGMSDSPLGRMEHATAVVDGHLYVYGGIRFTSEAPAPAYLDDLWELDPQTHTWTQLSPPGAGGAPLGKSSLVMVAPR